MVSEAASSSPAQDSSHSPSRNPVVAPGQATVPVQFQGKWAASQAQCGVPSESRLAIYPDRVDFYESRGRVLAVKVVSDREIELELELSGEGQVWRSTTRFGISADGRSLTDLTTPDHQFVRVRCEDARAGP